MFITSVCSLGLILINRCERKRTGLSTPPGFCTRSNQCLILACLFTLRAKLCGTMYCNQSCLWVCLCVYGSVTTITRNCVHRSSPNWVCRWMFTISIFLREGGLQRGENFWLRLTTASVQCLHLWAYFSFLFCCCLLGPFLYIIHFRWCVLSIGCSG